MSSPSVRVVTEPKTRSLVGARLAYAALIPDRLFLRRHNSLSWFTPSFHISALGEASCRHSSKLQMLPLCITHLATPSILPTSSPKAVSARCSANPSKRLSWSICLLLIAKVKQLFLLTELPLARVTKTVVCSRPVRVLTH